MDSVQTKIEWKEEARELKDLIPAEYNPRALTQKQLDALAEGRKLSKGNKGSHWSKEARIKFSQKKKGITLTIEHRIALSMAKKGKTIEHFNKNWDEIKQKISAHHTGKSQPWNQGEKHHNWQGGKTGVNFKIRNSLAMKNWRRQVLERDNYTCQICHVRGGRLVADHIKPFSTHPKLRFELSNGRTICKKCDLKSETYGGRASRTKK